MTIFLGSAIALTPVPIIAAYDPKSAITWLAFVFCAIAYMLHRKEIGQELLIAFLFALVVTSYRPYIYVGNNVLLGHINVFPLVAWTAGLVLLREVYERIHIPHRWLITSALYLLILFSLEYIGYYLVGIRIAPDSPSLLGLGIIHGPPFIHVFYVIAGPLYLLLTDYLRVK